MVEMGMGDTDVFEGVLRMGEDAFDGGEDLSCVGRGAGVDHYPFMGLSLVRSGGGGGGGGGNGVSADEESGDGLGNGAEGEDECAAEEAWAQFKELVLVWDQLGCFGGCHLFLGFLLMDNEDGGRRDREGGREKSKKKKEEWKRRN
jgi:hypothetical protein